MQFKETGLGWKTGGSLEEVWRKTGGRLEEDWRKTGGILEGIKGDSGGYHLLQGRGLGLWANRSSAFCLNGDSD